MSYQVLARKWRPGVFKDLIGQSSVVRILTNGLKGLRLHPALIFAGPRGTGKTSTARILAKSLSCPQVKDLVPCNKCKVCQDIDNSRSLDVMEIDGASNNGVEAVRQLKETITYLPSGPYKIYIIDEVHMLSVSAFNALLKTLEEPPPHAVFIMATTEMRKIPATVLSRCQILQFHQIPDQLIYEQLKKICQDENVQIEEDAIWMLTRESQGSLRDAQGLLDQMITFCRKKFDSRDVSAILGLTDRSLLMQSLQGLLEKDPEKILTVLNQLQVKGEDPFVFLQNLIKELRNLLLLKIPYSNSMKNLIPLSDQEKTRLLGWIQTVSPEDLHLLLDMVLKGSWEMTRVQDPKVFLEMLLLKMSQAPYIENLFGNNSVNHTRLSPSDMEKKPEGKIVSNYNGDSSFSMEQKPAGKAGSNSNDDSPTDMEKNYTQKKTGKADSNYNGDSSFSMEQKPADKAGSNSNGDFSSDMEKKPAGKAGSISNDDSPTDMEKNYTQKKTGKAGRISNDDSPSDMEKKTAGKAGRISNDDSPSDMEKNYTQKKTGKAGSNSNGDFSSDMEKNYTKKTAGKAGSNSNGDSSSDMEKKPAGKAGSISNDDSPSDMEKNYTKKTAGKEISNYNGDSTADMEQNYTKKTAGKAGSNSNGDSSSDMEKKPAGKADSTFNDSSPSDMEKNYTHKKTGKEISNYNGDSTADMEKKPAGKAGSISNDDSPSDMEKNYTQKTTGNQKKTKNASKENINTKSKQPVEQQTGEEKKNIEEKNFPRPGTKKQKEHTEVQSHHLIQEIQSMFSADILNSKDL